MSESLFEEGMSLYNHQDFESAIQKFKEVVIMDSLLYSEPLVGLIRTDLFNNKKKYCNQYAKMWIASCFHHLGKDSIAQETNRWYLFEPYDRNRVRVSDSLRLQYQYSDISIANKELYLKKNRLAAKLDSIEFGKYTPRYFESLEHLSSAYSYSREFDNELQVLLEMKDIGETLLDPSSPIYRHMIGTIGITYSTLWQYSTAIKYLEKYFSLRENCESKFDNNLTLINPQLTNLSYCYIITKQPEKAFSLMKKRIEEKQAIGYRNIGLFDQSDLIQAKRDYAHTLHNAGYTKEALREYLDITDSIQPNEYIFNDIASCYLDLNDTEHAREYLKKSQKTRDEENDFIKGFIGLENRYTEELLVRTEFQDGNIKKAIDLLEGLIEKMRSEVDDKQRFYSNEFGKYQALVSMLSNYYINDNQFDKAIEIEESNLRFKKKYYKVNSPTMGTSYYNIGEAYAGKHEYRKALEYTEIAFRLRKDHFIDNDHILMNLIRLYSQLGKKKQADYYLEILYTLKRKQISYFFSELTEQEKRRYWIKNKFFFTQFIPEYTSMIGTDKTYGIFYNSILDSKGIILDSEKVLRKSILESGDKHLHETFSKIQEYKQIILNELSKKEERNQVAIASLANKVNALEDELIIHSKEFRDLATWKKCNWRAIQNKLTKKDVAIEFVSMKTHHGKEIYAALVIKKGAHAPIFVELCKKEEIIRQYKDEHQNYKGIDQLIWKPLSKHLKDIERIFFSPSGLLYNYGIEYADEVKDMKVFRLSSTKEIITPKSTKKGAIDALLIGGLNYNRKAKHQIKAKSELPEFESMRDFDNNELRGGTINYLPYTRKEIIDIEHSLSKENECVLLSGDEGTEESVRHCILDNPRIIHIATHGSYIQKENPGRATNGSVTPVTEHTNNILSEDVSLTRSFLLMSGCNEMINSDIPVDQKEDGVLTAQEISQMDLRSCELVSLSACQTGLGDITHDGVIGLQRGFKRAGAQSMIMSLTKVNDRATYEFMREFYKEYMTSDDIKEAFNHSIKVIRKKYPTQTEYWRSFILMDVLE